MAKYTLPIKNTFESLISILDLGTLNDEYEYFYRGCSDAGWRYNLLPGIYRPDNDGGNKVLKEHINFREMILRSPMDFVNEGTTLEKLVKMQHYTLPTRLLDITSNPLIALYFSCLTFNKNDPKDSNIYVFKIRKEDIKYYDSDAVSLVSNLAKLSVAKTDFTNGFGCLMHEIWQEKPHFDDDFNPENKNDIIKVFPVKVKLNNNRIVRQNGAFLIFGMKDITSKVEAGELSDYSIDKEIIILNESKESLLNLLNALSINENTLFPELEHQANNLNR